MRQRFLKAISCIALMISVFFCSTVIALADDDSSYIEIVSSEDYNVFSGLSENDYTGSSIVQVLSQRAIVDFSQYNPTETVLLATVDLPLYLTIGFEVNKGHTYSGSIQWLASATLNFPDIYDVDGFTFFGYDAQSPSGIDVSIYPVLIYPSDAVSDFTVNINFNNWQSTYDGYVYINVCLNYRCTYKTNYSPGLISTVVGSTFITSTDWYGTLKDYPTAVITDSTGSLINNQTQQQQQIADQQAQQSAQQHEDLKDGFTDNTYNNNVSNAGAQVDSYIDLEHNLLEQQNQQMSDYADTAFNLNTLSPYINAIALTSTFFTWIWNGYGEMSVVFVIVLAIGVACLILGIRRRG